MLHNSKTETCRLPCCGCLVVDVVHLDVHHSSVWSPPIFGLGIHLNPVGNHRAVPSEVNSVKGTSTTQFFISGSDHFCKRYSMLKVPSNGNQKNIVTSAYKMTVMQFIRHLDCKSSCYGACALPSAPARSEASNSLKRLRRFRSNSSSSADGGGFAGSE